VKICIYGAGAIGGHIAGHLARKGECEVSVVARGKTLQAIRERGLRVIAPEDDFTVPVHAVEHAEELPRQDYVFLSLKAHQVDPVLPKIRLLMDEETVVLPPTTGIPYYFFHDPKNAAQSLQLEALDPGGRQWDTIPPRQAMGIVYWIGAHAEAPGVVKQDGAKAGCPIGELDGSLSPRVTRLSEALASAGIHAPVRTNIRGDIWVKFVNSLCWNPVAILTLARLGEIGGRPDTIGIVRRMMEEADALAAKLDLAVPQPPEKRIALTLSAAHHKMSMLQDLEQGRPLELGALASSIEAVAAVADMPTPLIDDILALAKLRAEVFDNARAAPASTSAAA
jgi:2-dehydropantoate 2-reductase